MASAKKASVIVFVSHMIMQQYLGGCRVGPGHRSIRPWQGVTIARGERHQGGRGGVGTRGAGVLGEGTGGGRLLLYILEMTTTLKGRKRGRGWRRLAAGRSSAV